MEDLKEVQEREIEVLQAIYQEDFAQAESRTAWKAVNAAHEFRVCVRPVEEDLKDKVYVWIRFKLPQRYPKVAPTMTLEDAKGLASQHLAHLLTTLQRFASSRLGDEMIYDICSQAASYITERHVDSVRGAQPSLEDQRRKRGEEQAKATQEAETRARALKEQQEAEEAARLSQLISEDVRRKEEVRLERERRERELDRERESGSLEVDARGEKRMKMEVTKGGAKVEAVVKFGYPHSTDWLGGLFSAQLEISGKTEAVGVFAFDILAPYYLSSQGKRKVAKLEADLDRIFHLSHPRLLSTVGYRIVRYSPGFFPLNPALLPSIRSGEGWTLLVVTPPNRSQSLDELLSTVGELRPDRALAYFAQLVSAVESLHSYHVVHRAIRPKTIFVTSEKSRSDSSEAAGVKLAGAGWYRRLLDLNRAEPWLQQPAEEELPDGWVCPEAVSAPFTYDRSRDMYELGVVLAQMLYGLDVTRKFPTPADLVRSMPRSSPSIIKRMLNDLLLAEGKKRPTAARLAAQLAEDSGSSTSHGTLVLSATPPKPLNGWQQLANGQQVLTPLMSPPAAHSARDMAAPSGFFWQPRAAQSRYREEFEELEFLGRGGGGQVVKARNRLDGHLYAVKKIRLPNDRASEAKILREVTIWSRMNHPNIVRYHTSWTSFDDPVPSFDALGSGTTLDSNTGTQTLSTTDASTQPSTENDDSGSDDSDSVVDFDEDSTPGDFDMDFGDELEDNLDFLSVGHAQSQSVSYPSIHFGNEDDPSRPGSERGSPGLSRAGFSKPPTKASTPVSTTPKQSRTLYIQMEYVEKLTLREAIEDGISEADSWRWIYQILSAMLHFTSLNIIHRDLKPSNIFIDVKGDVRIGDFGLAVGSSETADVFLAQDGNMDESDLTSGVGTSLYIAPETINRGRQGRATKHYNNKVDMYSLGIVFFEMWHPFKTGMERIQVLHDLRRPEIIFPPTWDKVRLARHTKIVQACLTHDPELRPSPKDLLQSDLLPPRVGDDSIEETIRLLSQPGTTHAQTLITALFNQSDEDRLRKDFSYDFYDGSGAKADNDPYAQLVHDKLSRIFRQKGAVQMDSPLLMPHSQVYASRKPVRLLDADGTIVCLPFQLNIPFCRMVARDTSLTRMKRWTIAPVFRPTQAGGQPRAVLNAAFDIVSDAVMPAMEAECLFVIEEILSAFPLTGTPAHIINHSKILDALLDIVPAKQRDAVCDILVQHGRLQRTWVKTASELLKLPGVTRAMCEALGTVDVAGDVGKMRSLVISAARRLKHVAQEGFDELKDIVALCRQIGIKNIKVAPLLAANYDLHRDGTIFESHVLRGKTRDVIAAGGRFDEVVTRLAAPEVRFSGRCPHVVGFSMAIAKLSVAAAEANATVGKQAMTRKEEHLRSYGPWAIRRCDVYVVSFSPGLIDLRLEIVKDLWRNGIKADLMYDDDFLSLTPEQLVNACRREGILWLVIVKPSAAGRTVSDESEKSLKVKSVLRGSEDEVGRAELSSWLVKELREQSTADEAAGGGAADAAVETSGSSLAEPPKPQQDYIPVLPDDDLRQKGRHNKRTMIVSRAQKNVEEAVEAAAHAPVFAVDVDGLSFERMAHSPVWVTNDEAFKTLVQTAPPGKRDYYTSIRKSIQRTRQKQHISRFWLFSLRDSRSVLMSFFDGV
ncbi:eukaryotic translation initiation factor 2-alpha kinase [Rhodotorula toruloides]|uniref:non-specific serine/threonine protein kinase n=1 Tax=Rhodotorula toruloides TaxID=5286 RepID=A0A0K3CFD4_RHOTO|nr:Protein kinase-like domain-containing protein [Rhodotorula toruloides]